MGRQPPLPPRALQTPAATGRSRKTRGSSPATAVPPCPPQAPAAATGRTAPWPPKDSAGTAEESASASPP
eukprot:1914049-Heterocapsa_arctica.AAC.1